MTCGVYCITNSITKKVYVGQSRNIEDRWKHHISAMKSGKHENSRLQNAWNKYGSDTWLWEVLEECEISQLVTLEQNWIDKFQAANRKLGYNINPIAGACPICPWTQERKDLASSILRQKYLEDPLLREVMAKASREFWGQEGVRNAQREKVLAWYSTEEGVLSRYRCGERSKTLWRDPEFRERIVAQMKAPSQARREQASLQARQNWINPEIRAKIVAKMKAHRHSDATKQKIGEAHLGLKRSEEGKKNMSEARLKKFATDPEFVERHMAQSQSPVARERSRANFLKTWEDKEKMSRILRDARRVKREQRILDLKTTYALKLEESPAEELKVIMKIIKRLEASHKKAQADYERKYG